ncbi:MAG: hypothetical protein V3V08_23545 [Nannocystaceae bacterium]
MSTSYRRCPTCDVGHFDFEGPHVCPPEWCLYWTSELAKHPDRDPGEDAFRVRGDDPESAAKKWAEEYDQDGDYHIVGGDSQEMTIWKPGEFDEATRWLVRGEGVPSYWAEVMP